MTSRLNHKRMFVRDQQIILAHRGVAFHRLRGCLHRQNPMYRMVVSSAKDEGETPHVSTTLPHSSIDEGSNGSTVRLYSVCILLCV